MGKSETKSQFLRTSLLSLDSSSSNNNNNNNNNKKKKKKKSDNGRITQYLDAVVPTLLQWKSNEYYILWVCVCSLSYPTCNAHVPYCHLWPALLYNIFPQSLINGTIFEKSCWT